MRPKSPLLLTEFKTVAAPFLGYRNEADVIEEANNIIFNRARGKGH